MTNKPRRPQLYSLFPVNVCGVAAEAEAKTKLQKLTTFQSVIYSEYQKWTTATIEVHHKILKTYGIPRAVVSKLEDDSNCMTTLYLLYSVRITPGQLLEGALAKFPNYYVIGVLVAPAFSEGMDDEVLSDLVDYMSTISELNIGEEEYQRRIEDLKLQLQEYENISSKVQDLQISIQDLVAQNQELHQEIEARDQRLQFLLYLKIVIPKISI
ncbi:5825_t:CDS:2 [Paraglomus brasilianum]|uniref:5825_t:CDS:1 n=1 Tax=Paraglomus brasilianum TaxID=144538 RepID=A0A9N9BI78_9GLOM|nr:5825_t:CDS:2 [Paraglomus brasilianum]